MDKLESTLSKLPVATLLVLVFAVVGGVVTIVNPDALSFDKYIAITMGSAAALGIGRGIATGKSTNVGSVETLVTNNGTTKPAELQYTPVPGEGDPLPPA